MKFLVGRIMEPIANIQKKQKPTPRMSVNPTHSKNLSIYILVAVAAGLYCLTHLANSWLFSWFEVSEHINFVYLPSFLRLANVLVLGMLWGTCATAFGGMLLFIWSSDNLALSVCNMLVSASSAALAVVLMQFMQKRTLAMTLVSDLLKLALLYSVLNALAHHALWSVLDTSQLIESNQLMYMVIGDINGAILGALALRWLASHSQLIAFARHKATEASQPDHLD